MGLVKTEKLLSRTKIYNKIDRLLKKQNFDTSEYVGAIMGAYREKEIFSKKFISAKGKYHFSYFMADGPKDFDGYLKHMYGDYTRIPSIDEINEKKNFRILEE